MTATELDATIRRILERPKEQRALLAKVRQGHYGARHVVAAYWQTLRRLEAQGVHG